MSSIFVSEFIGTMILILLGNGVVANVVLNKTNGNNSGWIVITFGWAIAVFTGVFIASRGIGGAHLNPAVTIAMAWLGKIEWSIVPQYFGGQILGAMAGSLLVWLSYYKHFEATEDGAGKLAVFATMPAINNPVANFFTELVGTFVLIFGVLYMAAPASSLGTLDALPVALLVLGIGLSLGGPTGYAINPARDLAPRLMHAILPIPSKIKSGWGYSWIPVIAPMVGAIIAAIVFNLVNK